MDTDKHLELLQKCSATCAATTTHCLEMGDEHAEVDHITTMIDCSTICATAADFVARKSSNAGAVMELCAEICRQCAIECEQHADGDDLMLACAKVCRECADECDEINR